MNTLPAINANYEKLTPTTFLRRTSQVFPHLPAVIHGPLVRTWGEVGERCARLARALSNLGIREGDVVSVLCPNTPQMFEVHFGVPMMGAVLNTLNTRLDAATIAFSLDHSGAKAFLVDSEFSALAKSALAQAKGKPVVVDVVDTVVGERIGQHEYEDLLRGVGKQCCTQFTQFPKDEWDTISLNYTSGTTGNPKGVLYHHRGAYLNAVGNALAWKGMESHPVYLWTLPMFHCNGWCFPWTMAAVAGVNVCLRNVNADTIRTAIKQHKVTHMCGAPIVMAFILEAVSKEVNGFSHQVHMMTAAAPPPPPVLAKMRKAGIAVTHVYGLTESYGPATICEVQHEWRNLPDDEYAQKVARQGVRYHMLEGLDVLDPDTLKPVPRDGKTMGEIAMRGNIIMKGYLNNPKATAKTFPNNEWFLTGDIAVMHPDGYIQIRDRAKDIIISGGENISSIEIEQVLYKHPAVSAVAVVAKADDKWGEVPCAFVELQPGKAVTAQELRALCEKHLARFKLPKAIHFGELPKTSTGKIRKNVLREKTALVAKL